MAQWVNDYQYDRLIIKLSDTHRREVNILGQTLVTKVRSIELAVIVTLSVGELEKGMHNILITVGQTVA